MVEPQEASPQEASGAPDPGVPPVVQVPTSSQDLSLLDNHSMALTEKEEEAKKNTTEATSTVKPAMVSSQETSSSNSITGSDASNKQDSAEMSFEKDNKNLSKLYIELLRFLAMSGEIQKNANCFHRDYHQNPADWTTDHFFQQPIKTIPPNKDKKATTMPKPELYQICKSLGLKATGKMTKDELVKIFEDHKESSGRTQDATVEEDSKPAAIIMSANTKEAADQWTENEKTEEHGVITTSYEYALLSEILSLRKNLAIPAEAQADASWMAFSCPNERPLVPESDSQLGKNIERYLNHIKKHDPERFSQCDDVFKSMLPLLSCKDVKEAQDQAAKKAEGAEEVARFLIASLEYYKLEPMKSIYEKLFEWQNNDANAELILGLCHVRMINSTTKNGKPHKSEIVNGPLLEVPVVTKLQVDNHGSSFITIHPKDDAEVSINGEVFSAIISGGKSNSKLIDKLHELVKDTQVSSLRPEDPSTFRDILHTASLLTCGGKMRSAKDNDVHLPPMNRLVITDAFCLYSQAKKSTPFSRDSRNIIALNNDKGNISMTKPIRGLLSGPGSLENQSVSLKAEDLVYTLPASENQKEAGLRLLVDGESVVNLVGPPGTGKTHTIVNIASTTLSVSKSVIVSSSNPRALKAFVDKLPAKLRALALDISSVEEHGVVQFQTALETMVNAVQRLKKGQSEKEIERISNGLKKKKEELAATLEKFKSATNQAQRLLDEVKFKNAIELACDLSQKAPWLLKAILTQKLTGVKEILEQFRYIEEPVSFNGSDDGIVYDAFLRLLQEQGTEAASNGTVVKPFKFGESSSDEKLSRIQIGGRDPTSKTDWENVMNAFIFQEKCIKPLVDCGCVENEMYKNDKKSFHDDFIAFLVQGRQLEDSIESLDEQLKSRIKSSFEGAPISQLQYMYKKQTSEIQQLESEVVFLKSIAFLKERLDEDALSTLKKMNQGLKKMRSGALASGNTKTERSSRHFKTFANLFKEAAKFMPFLVMTIEQVSIYLPATHSCDIGIVDESSQSPCTAINFMARCKQMLIVGDDKQVSPSQCFLSEERVRGLRKSLPAIPTAEQLLPESSFFDLCQAAFPSSDVALCEHYRCDPEIISISNQLFYLGELIPLRLPGKSQALEDMPVGGTREKKTNTTEAEAIATRIYNEILRTAESDEFQTIAVISLGGTDQCKLVKNLVDEKIEELIEEYGSDVVDRHDILYGTSSESQGDERDIVFLSAVYSAPNKGKLPQDDNWKAWNVALTRAKNKLILCRSFGIKDLKTTDIRSKIFRFFMNAKKGMSNELIDGPMMMLEPDELVIKVGDVLSASLKRYNFTVKKKGGAIWHNALCVEAGASDNCALLYIENSGESEEEWKTMFDQQLSLERAGRSCLRVDFLSLVLNFDATFADLLAFLDKSGLPSSSKRESSSPATASPPKKPKTEAAVSVNQEN